MNGRSIIMTANASARAIKPELLRTYTEDFNKDRANLIAADAAVSAGVLKAATDYRGVRALPRDFSIELKQGSITNQERSGRCWMFASLNTLRYELMHRWNLEDFEFSETYLFFWDAMESRTLIWRTCCARSTRRPIRVCSRPSMSRLQTMVAGGRCSPHW